MRKSLLLVIVLLILAALPAGVKAAPIQSDPPVVNAIIFWMSGCPFCEQVLTSTLPPIQDKYASQLNILLIELSSSDDLDKLYTLGASFGLSKELVGVPFLIIDHTVLVGADEIEAKLTGVVDQYLRSGGAGYPDIPLLGEMLPRGIAYSSSEPYMHLIPQAASTNPATGMILAWVIMVFMVLALIAAIAILLRAFQGKPLGNLKRWLDIAIPILAIIGLGAAIYLTYVETTHTRALCGPVGDCNAVQSSPYARLFGLIPIGLVGAVGYILILAAWLWNHSRSGQMAKLAGPALYAMALFGTLFSIYLTYLELFVIHAVCIWCLSSAVIITLLMLLGLPPITQWLAISDEEE